MKTWQHMLIGFLLGLLVSGLLLLIIKTPQGDPLTLAPSPTKAPIFVHISGAVKQPGVYSLPVGSRVADLVNQAGGFLSEAESDSVNLAEILSDGTKIHIYSASEMISEVVSQENERGEEVSVSFPLNINTASLADFEKLPGIGPAKAAQIIEYRNSEGRFLTIEDIMNVPGIGTALFETIQDMIVVK